MTKPAFVYVVVKEQMLQNQPQYVPKGSVVQLAPYRNNEAVKAVAKGVK